MAKISDCGDVNGYKELKEKRVNDKERKEEESEERDKMDSKREK